ncbi:hypothetical protein H2201_005150 [Coniosporium apollinis]|uniref:Uncharacterized protein n=1 Tax=Coniosporium apollinis TaxID=61459 RepID=A0ABQ9NVY0_9PEZI|nr:hypothetical protein H2201_005150 [Coniosporium apollinis]
MHTKIIVLAIVGALAVSISAAPVAAPVAVPEAAPVAEPGRTRYYWKSRKQPVWCFDRNILANYICGYKDN